MLLKNEFIEFNTIFLKVLIFSANYRIIRWSLSSPDFSNTFREKNDFLALKTNQKYYDFFFIFYKYDLYLEEYDIELYNPICPAQGRYFAVKSFYHFYDLFFQSNSL